MKPLLMKEHCYLGKLITFCGLDGCGKTTMINLLEAYLKNKGYSVVLTKQPTPEVRRSNIFRNYMDSPNNERYEYRSLSLLAASDRVQHSEKFIRPLLEEGKIVISDRYYYSCLANLYARGYENDLWIYEIANSIIKPDVAIFLDVDVRVATQRIRERIDEKDRYIDAEFQKKLKELYIQISKENSCPIFDTGNKKTDETFSEIVNEVNKILL